MSKIFPSKLKEFVHIKYTEWAYRMISVNVIVSRLRNSQMKGKGIPTLFPGKMVAFHCWPLLFHFLKCT